MILDELGEFADATSVVAAAGTALIGDVINTQVVRDVGHGHPIYLVVTTATEIITGGTAGTIKFHLASDAQAAIAVDGSATIHATSPTYVTDDAAANSAQLGVGGFIWVIALPQEGAVYEQYLGILCEVVTTAVTAGAINAFLTLDPPKFKHYPDAI